MMEDIKILRQKPVTIFEYNQELEIDATYEGSGIPVVGLSTVVGMIYTNKNVNLIVSQGCNDKGGTLNYRHIKPYKIDALSCEPKEFRIFGKFIKIAVQNISGEKANIESFFYAMGI